MSCVQVLLDQSLEIFLEFPRARISAVCYSFLHVFQFNAGKIVGWE